MAAKYNPAIMEGVHAHRRGEPSTANPYLGVDEANEKAWHSGWINSLSPSDRAFEITNAEAGRLKREAAEAKRLAKRKR